MNLNINQCKMCMPLGASLAFKGVEGSIVILHGSQGCSTYIRRHMATHYNEPIDIASSSLTENGAVFGGTKNLKSGIKNLIKVYNPKIIGIFTTCLADTIGEDIDRIVKEFIEEEHIDTSSLKLVTAHTPGYGATQTEGYYVALRKTVEQLSKKGHKNNKVNIIAANLNPGDIRNIKNYLNEVGVGYIMFPDISETLDGEYRKTYERIPPGGTKINDIVDMANSLATIEMGISIDRSLSPGQYLSDNYGVPLYVIPAPIGLRNTDNFLDAVKNICGKEIPEVIRHERGRLLDAMIDAHKYNAQVRAIVYGDPEIVYSLVLICEENGILPKIIATGSNNSKFEKLIKDKIKNFNDEIIVLNDTDFETIESYATNNDINLLIGNSDGRRLAEKLKLEIVRIGFPIHDRLGAQRVIFTGYNGSANFIDLTSNSILARKEEGFREEAFDKYYKKSTEKENNLVKISNIEHTKTHPCFNKDAHQYSRMHIPVAPACNISCNYCNRKYDCSNESRPGVTSEILKPEEALRKYIAVKQRFENLSVVGIAGPGEALANFDNVRKSVKLIKQFDPKTTFCLSTNGLMLPFYANELIDLGFSNITITINTVLPEVAAKIYRDVNYLGENFKGIKAGEVIINNQLDGLRFLSMHGIVCKVNLVLIKGINDFCVEDTVRKVKDLGAYITNIMPMIPVKGSVFENFSPVNQLELKEIRDKCGSIMKQMYHCRQCRADAIGTLDKDCSSEFACKG